MMTSLTPVDLLHVDERRVTEDARIVDHDV